MFKTTWVLAASAFIALSACVTNDVERGLIGAAAGATIANVTGGDSTTGALIGGGAGVFCDNAGLC